MMPAVRNRAPPAREPVSVPASRILHLLQRASREIRDLDLGSSVDRVALADLNPLRFATEYVQRNKPVIITGALDSWPAMRLWGERYLESHPAREAVVTVDVTPNGRGDAITAVADPATGQRHRWFVIPHERRMSLGDFFRLMRETRAAERAGPTARGPREVPYMQHQNSNLTEEMGQLMADIGRGLPWAESVFGGPPEATNIWIGDGRSATSFHKDHYENLYAVIRGTKVFTLLPPCDVHRMYLVRCPAAAYMPRRDVPPGAAYGEVCHQPRRSGGCGPGELLLPPAAAAAVAAAPESQLAPPLGQPSTSRPEDVRGETGPATAPKDPDELVAVLQEPAYEVLWSAVDTTVRDPVARAAQPLFFGSRGGSACDDGRGGCKDDGDDDDNNDDDPWFAAGGAPLVAEVGPGELLYLPSLWFHQVEQYCGAEEGEAGEQAEGEGAGRGGRGRSGSGRRKSEEGEQNGQPQQGQEDEEEYVIAINFWYDMKYDGRYSAFKLVEGLATALGLADEPPQRESEQEV